MNLVSNIINSINPNEIYKSVVYFLNNPKAMQDQVKICSETLNGIKSESSSSLEASKILNNYLSL